MSVWEQILNCFLPPRCLKCGKPLKQDLGLCGDCIEDIGFICEPYCQKCGQPFEFLETQNGKLLCGNCLKNQNSPFRLSRSAFVYNQHSKLLITDLKYNDKTENAKLLAKIMWVAGKEIFEAGVDVIIPVPLHYSRLIKRRYNQSALIGNELSKISGIPIDNTTLRKHKKTRPQIELSGNERQNNVRNAFSVRNHKKIAGKRILLIDDVLTTGATLKECAKALLKA
ncbi:MAG: ComF family protein, partial [Alphaproteobacteria bacterium]|nr:ComF family protein [Alphaproteobacteria bacterium]